MLADTDPLIRRAAVEALAGTPPSLRRQWLPRLLDDPIKGVRLSAARWLADVPMTMLDIAIRTRFRTVIDEYIAVQQFNADRPEAYNNLGTLFADQGDWAKAESALKMAVQIAPELSVSKLNLADVYRATGREEEAQSLLNAVIQDNPQDAVAHHALGLSMIRQHRIEGAKEFLRKAMRLAPQNAHYRYVYAVALNETGRRQEAIKELKAGLKSHPDHRESIDAMVALCRQLRDEGCARLYSGRWR